MIRPAMVAAAVIAASFLAPLWAAEARPLTDNPQVEQRLNNIAAELRCLVCQNESLAGSRADLAVDLRREVRARIARGDSDDAIKTFLVDRYGDFILYRPPWKASTLLLWLGPVLLLAIGLALLFRQLRRRRNASPASEAVDAELTNEERARLTLALSGDGPIDSSEAPRR